MRPMRAFGRVRTVERMYWGRFGVLIAGAYRLIWNREPASPGKGEP